MEPLKIDASIDTPNVSMDSESGCFEISGRSYPEDTLDFYAPILKYMDDYALAPKPATTFTFKLGYFNSSSYKPILDLIVKMDVLHQQGNKATVEWYYKSGDTDMKEAGEEFQEIVSVPFTYHTF